MTAELLRKMSIAGKGLRYKLLLVEILVFALPSFMLFYAFFTDHSASRTEFALICLAILFLVLSGLLLLRQIFDRIATLACVMVKASEGVRTSLEANNETAELHDIVTAFKHLQKNLDNSASELDKRLHDMLAIKEMSEIIGNSKDTSEQLKALLDKSMSVTGAAVGAIFYSDKAGDNFPLIHVRGLEAPSAEMEEAMRSLTSRVAADGEIISVSDPASDSSMSRYGDFIRNIASALAMPISVNHSVTWVLFLAHRSSSPVFDESDLHVLSIMIDRFKNAHCNVLLQTINDEQVAKLKEKSNALLDEVNRCKQTEEALRRSEERHRTIIENIEDSYYEVDLAGNAIFYNKASSVLFGYSPEELLGMNFHHIMDEENAAAAFRSANEVYNTGKPATGIELEIIRKDGTRRYIELSISLMNNPDGKTVGFRGIGRDTTERKKAEIAISRLAYHDSLTGLPNRRLVTDRLTVAMAHARRNRQRLCVMIIDLDEFKQINDALGHQAGDIVLQGVAERLSRQLRKSDTAARIGGDEFMIVLPEMTEMRDAEIVASKIMDVFKETFLYDDKHLSVTASAGIAVFPDHAEGGDILIGYADSAMYLAKARGRNNYQFYQPNMQPTSHTAQNQR